MMIKDFRVPGSIPVSMGVSPFGTQVSAVSDASCHSTCDYCGMHVTCTGNHYMKCLCVCVRRYCGRVH